MRFHFNGPDAVAHALRELALPRQAYDSLLTEVTRPSGFITEDEIDAALSSGSPMAGGKGRIYRYFTAYPAHTAREKADFLKSEYGIGGHSHAVSGFDHSAENHDGRGIKLEKGNCPVVQLSWAQVAARIDTMITHDRYMTQQELADIGAPQVEEPADEPIDTEAVRERLADAGIVNGEVVDEEALRNSPFIQQVTELAEQIQVEQDEAATPAGREIPYKVGDTVYLDDKAFVITQIGRFNVQLQDPSQAYPIFRSESHESLARLLAQDERNAGMYAPQPVRDESTAFTSEPVAIYPAAENGLPYDVVVERLHAESPEHAAPFPPAADNFRITDEHLGEGGPKAKFRMNTDAIQLLHQLEAEHRTATPEEQTILSCYVGWGGLADAFDPDKPAWADEYRQLAASLTPEEYEAARASTLNAHYTSPTVIRAITIPWRRWASPAATSWSRPWAWEISSACRSSGQSVKTWCRENGVSEQTYYKWQRRLYELAQDQQKSRFAEVTPQAKNRSDIAVTVQIGDVEMAIHNGADAATVEAVLRAMKSC